MKVDVKDDDVGSVDLVILFTPGTELVGCKRSQVGRESIFVSLVFLN